MPASRDPWIPASESLNRQRWRRANKAADVVDRPGNLPTENLLAPTPYGGGLSFKEKEPYRVRP